MEEGHRSCIMWINGHRSFQLYVTWGVSVKCITILHVETKRGRGGPQEVHYMIKWSQVFPTTCNFRSRGKIWKSVLFRGKVRGGYRRCITCISDRKPFQQYVTWVMSSKFTKVSCVGVKFLGRPRKVHNMSKWSQPFPAICHTRVSTKIWKLPLPKRAKRGKYTGGT